MNQSGSPLLLFCWPKLTSIHTLPPLASHLRDQNSPFLMFNQKLAQRERPSHRTQNKRKYQMMQDFVIFLGCVGLNLGKRYRSRNMKVNHNQFQLYETGNYNDLGLSWVSSGARGPVVMPLVFPCRRYHFNACSQSQYLAYNVAQEKYIKCRYLCDQSL